MYSNTKVSQNKNNAILKWVFPWKINLFPDIELESKKKVEIPKQKMKTKKKTGKNEKYFRIRIQGSLYLVTMSQQK